jgi:hypothetical protein
MLMVISPFLVAGVTGTLGTGTVAARSVRTETTGREPVRTALVLAELSGWER